MKISPSTNNKVMPYQLCIGLEPPPKRSSADDVEKAISFTCHRSPGDVDTPKYMLKAYPFEDGQGPETFILTLQKMQEIAKGQNITTVEDKVILVRQLFKGAVLTAFENELPENTRLQDTHIRNGMRAMAKVVFPDKAYRNQKKALKRLKKPKDMTFRMFANRMKKLNEYLVHFPVLPNGNAPRAIPNDELAEVLHDALPKKGYQDVMQQHNYDPTGDTIQKFIEWVERRCEPFDNPPAKNDSPPSTKVPRKKRPADESGSYIKDGDRPSKKKAKWCLLHKHCDHTTDQCKVMKAKADEQARNNKPWRNNNDKKNKDAHYIDDGGANDLATSEEFRKILQKDMATMALKVFKAYKRKLDDRDANMAAVDDDGSIMELNTDEDPMDMGSNGTNDSTKMLSDEQIDELIQKGIDSDEESE